MVSFNPWPLSLKRKKQPVSTEKEMSAPHSQSGGGGKEINPAHARNQTPVIQLITDHFTLYYSSLEIKF
jgi:hypothetical protein